MVDRSRLHHDVRHPLRNLVLGRVVFAGRKGYSRVDVGFAMSTYPIAGLAGAILSGIISDKLFKGRPDFRLCARETEQSAGRAHLFELIADGLWAS